MKKDNDNEERLIETIVTIGSLIFFGLLTMYAMRGCSDEGIKGDLAAVTAIAVPATVTDAPVDVSTNLMADADANATMDADTNATMDADANATTDADANATTDADANATTDADANATTDADANATTDADANVATDADANTTIDTATNATTDADANAATDANANVATDADRNTNTRERSEADEEAGIIADINNKQLSVKPYILKGIYFKSGSSILSKKSKRQLDRVAKALKIHNDVKVTLRGHTDSKGSQKENQALSLKRASSVGMALVERGVNIDNIWIDGMGETEPITLNGTAKEMLLNRRVDISVTK